MNADNQEANEVSESVSDEHLAGFIGDAETTISAEDKMYESIAELLDRPFDPMRQSQLAQVLTSRALTAANQAAARLSSPYQGERS